MWRGQNFFSLKVALVLCVRQVDRATRKSKDFAGLHYNPLTHASDLVLVRRSGERVP